MTDTPEQPGTRSVSEWRSLLFAPSPKGRLHPDLWRHGAAEALHRWTLHAHHTGAEMQLTRDDYEAALAAASEPDEAGNYEPHDAALARSQEG
jgi:hypothetical protein